MPKQRITIILQSRLNSSPDYSSLRFWERLGGFTKDKRADAYNKVFNKLAKKKK